MRRLSPFVLCALLYASGAPAVAQSFVDLDAPGALAALRTSNPDRYHEVAAILDSAARLPRVEAEGIIRARHEADDVSIGELLMTSYPAKRRVSFRLSGQAYRAVVTLRGPRRPPSRCR